MSGGCKLTASSLSLDGEFYGNDIPLKKPPRILFIIGFVSVLFGALVGLYGIFKAGTASNSQQFLVGLSGYVLTALFPIILLQVILVRHTSAMALNQDEPYDNYAGEQMQRTFRKVVFAGLLLAGLSIWVFFLPIAERFAA